MIILSTGGDKERRGLSDVPGRNFYRCSLSLAPKDILSTPQQVHS